jgi:hypothetical protein
LVSVGGVVDYGTAGGPIHSSHSTTRTLLRACSSSETFPSPSYCVCTAFNLQLFVRACLLKVVREKPTAPRGPEIVPALRVPVLSRTVCVHKPRCYLHSSVLINIQRVRALQQRQHARVCLTYVFPPLAVPATRDTESLTLAYNDVITRVRELHVCRRCSQRTGCSA